jgi:hypothetical protein
MATIRLTAVMTSRPREKIVRNTRDSLRLVPSPRKSLSVANTRSIEGGFLSAES